VRGSLRTCSGLAYAGVITCIPVAVGGGLDVERVRVQELRDPEVEEARRAVGRHEDVRRLEVPVDHEVLVRVLHRRADRAEEEESLPDAEAVAVAVLAERPPLDVLHDEVRQAVLGRPSVEQLRDVRVVERRQDLPLPAEPGDDLGRVHPLADDLDRDVLAELLVRPRREVDRPHAPLAEPAEDLVGADPEPADRIVLGRKDGRRAILAIRLAGGRRVDPRRIVVRASAHGLPPRVFRKQ